MPSVQSSQKQSVSVPIIGILGGIGSGKSSVVSHVRRLKLLIVDADRIGHALLDSTAVAAEIRQTFGQRVFRTDGSVDRARLANLVFGREEEHKNALRKLEQILHPAIRCEMTDQTQAASQDVDAVIWDAALLLEAGWADQCDALVFIDTPLKVRQSRVEKNRGWTSDELHRREAAQLPVDAKKAKADFVIDNSGSLEAASRQMETVLESIVRDFGGQ